MNRRTVQLQQGSYPGRPAFDTALSRALLHRVGEGVGAETLRLYQPDDVVAFSVLDRTRPGFGCAIEAAASGTGSKLSKIFSETCSSLRIKHARTRPYRPRTNGKAERFIQTLIREWAYAFTFYTSADRVHLLPTYLHFYTHHRAHSALGGQSPANRLSLNNAVGIHS